ncbi:hypothetical protein MMC07_005033 [Pseudocyphellaria aurata]|nr:hypothetical protein [Pseudocyphellaria aurata]
MEELNKPTYRSFKKKFLKMRHIFKEKMRESNSLFDDEQNAMKLARRLQEQNDQLLDLLLDVNESNHVPFHLRYDLRSPTPDATDVPALEPDRSPNKIHDANGARAALEEAKVELTTGQITPNTYKDLEIELLETINKPIRIFAQLDDTPHTTLSSVTPNDLPSDLDEDAPTGYLSPDHETEFLLNLDNTLGNPPLGSRPIISSQLAKANEREREKESQLRNPVSVHNWLRKHHPQVFQEEPGPEKLPSRSVAKVSPKPSNPPKASKRPSTVPKQENEYDDEGFLIGGTFELPPKSKRKREDEPYRPKGGSSRPTKRKRTSGGAPKRTLGDEEGI